MSIKVTFSSKYMDRGIWLGPNNQHFLIRKPIPQGDAWQYNLYPLSKYKIFRAFQIIYYRIVD